MIGAGIKCEAETACRLAGRRKAPQEARQRVSCLHRRAATRGRNPGNRMSRKSDSPAWLKAWSNPGSWCRKGAASGQSVSTARCAEYRRTAHAGRKANAQYVATTSPTRRLTQTTVAPRMPPQGRRRRLGGGLRHQASIGNPTMQSCLGLPLWSAAGDAREQKGYRLQKGGASALPFFAPRIRPKSEAWRKRTHSSRWRRSRSAAFCAARTGARLMRRECKRFILPLP